MLSTQNRPENLPTMVVIQVSFKAKRDWTRSVVSLSAPAIEAAFKVHLRSNDGMDDGVEGPRGVCE